MTKEVEILEEKNRKEKITRAGIKVQGKTKVLSQNFATVPLLLLEIIVSLCLRVE